MMDSNAIRDFWAANHKRVDGYGLAHCRRLTCADGFNVSIQASSAHYCTPREYIASGSYSAWELGYPTAHEPLLDEYAEQPSTPLQTVYGYVPTEVVNAVIAKHGGIADPSPTKGTSHV